MSLTMYDASVPVFRRMLGNLLVWLDRAEAHAQARRFSPDNYIGLRLAPDMLPFASQVRIACDNAKGCARRLAGVEAPVHADDEATLEQLRERVRSTLAFIESVPPERFEGSEQRPIEIPLRNREPLRFDGATYLRHYALPNVYFHLTTAYALLRQAGVDLGKADFLGSF